MWRTDHTFVQGSQSGVRNESFTEFDLLGRPIKLEAVLSGADPEDYGSIRRVNGASLPGDAASNTTFSQSVTAYDVYGNAIRTRAQNGRCAEVNYDDSSLSGYRTLATSESIFIAQTVPAGSPQTLPAATTACTGNDEELLTTTATYDRGIGVVRLATDLNLRNTLAVYDEFGRITALHKPSETIPSDQTNYAVAPSVQIEYFLPSGKWLPAPPLLYPFCTRAHKDDHRFCQECRETHWIPS
jgi:hypothetical protein